ncbi:Sterile alpha motif domain containing protein 3 [Dissostichus eleginoides]|uniref:Sterile alpha motif domain containing protein 3 n=1 Tax=Dissostichus eleginoides TaxID=100907 RepID=A0AAD9BRA8_DISEL|nr:Sterile alpha motif domain containing protein 3 [Dissostichus eleginoides]KAK1886544.1 Sterile alpha motif domain containing protein 3 [Dissostichus eleginoides]KAK1886573.1 Sterile alpha motif domain containing protein 3 [Dissostichus eleginoides]
MMQHERNPTRAMCHSIVRTIIRSHQKSFADISRRGEVVGDGCPSLLQQVKTRVEYKSRNNTLARRRRGREGRQHTGVAGESRLMRGPDDQYGCVRWCPTDLPEGETEATLEDLKRALRNIYSEEGMGRAERSEPLMERTYVILRRYLNRMPAPAMLEVKEEWPFLFSQRGLFSHFGLLTDVNILQKLQEALGQRGQTILQFCQTLDNPKVREVLASYEPEASEKAACILLLLMVYFKEPTEKLMLEVDTCATAADVVNTAALPSTPCLIIQARFSHLHRDSDAFTVCFLGINPEKGSKAKKRSSINPHVSTLHRKLIDFEWSA